MPLSRTQKQTIIAEVNATLKDADALILVHNNGLTVAQVDDLRRKMRAAGAGFRVVKNRLAARAIENTGFTSISNLLKGPTGLATSKDPVSAAKVMVEFAKTNEKLVILGGAFGETTLDAKGVEKLSKMPSMNELRGKLVGLLQAPAQRIATLMQANASGLARQIAAKAAKGE